MPRVNTLIVHRADMFGLAQLYQLRGRVGRGKIRAYAYFTVRSERLLEGAAEKRLSVIQALDSLGAGFSLASHDMDIRGAGNLLGEEQSGHVREVGVELYQQLLEEAVQAARAGSDGAAAEAEERWSPQITVGMAVLIPDAYVADLAVRLGLYRRLADLETDAGIEAFAAELVDRFGPLPDAAANLLALVRLKRLCRIAGVERLDAGPKGAVLAVSRQPLRRARQARRVHRPQRRQRPRAPRPGPRRLGCVDPRSRPPRGRDRTDAHGRRDGRLSGGVVVTSRADALALLRRATGRRDTDFRRGQWEAIDSLANRGGRLLVVERTGWGKSAVYFIATRILRDRGRGPTLIVSPLLALMRNQMEAAERLGVRALSINSTNRNDWPALRQAVLGNEADALLISPERLANDEFVEDVLLPVAERIGLMVVDEAHCISDWGTISAPTISAS